MWDRTRTAAAPHTSVLLNPRDCRSAGMCIIMIASYQDTPDASPRRSLRHTTRSCSTCASDWLTSDGDHGGSLVRVDVSGRQTRIQARVADPGLVDHKPSAAVVHLPSRWRHLGGRLLVFGRLLVTVADDVTMTPSISHVLSAVDHRLARQYDVLGWRHNLIGRAI